MRLTQGQILLTALPKGGAQNTHARADRQGNVTQVSSLEATWARALWLLSTPVTLQLGLLWAIT